MKRIVLSMMLWTGSVYAAPVCTDTGPECQLLNAWYLDGSAAGNGDDYYDNRDRGHSTLSPSQYPQINMVEYSDEERAKSADWAGQTRLRKQVTIGNSSTSAHVGSTGSNVRSFYYINAEGLSFLYRQYRANNLYMYPSHMDYISGHDGHPGFGDLYPTNTPYTIITRGSSGSDQPFLHGFVRALAALRPDVKQTLIAKGLLMPTLQYLFRMSNSAIKNPEDYLTGAAHPTVFAGDDFDAVKMIHAAHNLTTTAIPPLVALEMLSESSGAQDSLFKVEGSEDLGSTPSALARVWRSPSYSKRFVISAKRSYDSNFKPLKYHWVLLRGDPSKTKISPLESGEAAEITVSYQGRQPIAKGSPISSNRIDIGVFADNGISLSAPAFLTLYTLDSEARTYDRNGRLIEIYFNASDLGVDVKDWPALLATVDGDPQLLPTHLLQARLNPTERQALRQIATQLQTPLQAIAAIESKVKDGVLATAKQRQQMEEAQRKIQEILNTPVPELANLSPTTFMAQVFKGVLHDTGFYPDHAEALQSWIGQAPLPAQQKFRDQQQRLIKMGVLKDMGNNRFKIETPHVFANETGLSLTKFEEFQIAKLNLILLSQFLYPTTVDPWENVNYVDSRLATPNPSRYVYEYNDQGILVSWTRYNGEAEAEKQTVR